MKRNIRTVFLSCVLFVFVFPTFVFAQIEYFPNKIFAEDQSHHDFIVEWYSKHLVSLDAESLWKKRGDNSAHIYRLLILPTWGAPMILKLDVNAGTLTVRVTDGQGGYEAGKIVRNETIELDGTQLEKFYQPLNQLDFWQAPTKIKRIGADGTQWVLEGIWGKQYHILDRWTPETGEFRATGEVLLEFAGFDAKRY